MKNYTLIIITMLIALLLAFTLVSCKNDAAPSESAAPLITDTATDLPETDLPATELPATDVPATDVPATELPATDEPATDAPATDDPAANTLPSFNMHTVTWEYVEGSYEGYETSANVGIRLGDQPLPSANKYIKPELTAGDIDAVSFVELSGANLAEPHELYNFYLYLDADLPEGTYNTTLTLYYDAAGNGTDWVAIDTCELTAVITKRPEQYSGTCWLGAYNDRSPYGQVTFEGYGYWDTAVGGNEEIGRTFTAKAEPGAGYRFKEWQDKEGNVVSTSQDYTFTLEQETMLYVIFEKDPDWTPAPPTFGSHPGPWEYSAGSYDVNDTDVNVGILLGDYPLPTANMYIKVEITDGDIDTFSFTELTGSNYAEPHAQYNFWVYLKDGLPAGTYYAVLTLYYDVNGTGSDWVQVDTCELRAVISP